MKKLNLMTLGASVSLAAIWVTTEVYCEEMQIGNDL
jgi:hypothetical protein